MQPAPFIVGVPRSGTTLLRLQLDAHPELAIPPETGIGELLAGLSGDRPTRADLLEAITALPTWQDFGVTRNDLATAFEEAPSWSAAEGVRAYYRLYAASRGKPRYGDKTPGHARHMAVLAEALPEAHFVHVIRDGRDVAASLRNLPFAPRGGDMAAIAALWRDTIWRARRTAATLPHYTEVRYERLVTEPEAVLRELCEFLDMPFDPRMLAAHERAAERLGELRSATVTGDGRVRLSNGTEFVSRTLHPPDPARAGRWRTALGEYEIGRFERFAGGALKFAGYTPYARATAAADRPSAMAAGRTSPVRVILGRQALVAPGGTETYALTLARELERLGHEVTVATEQAGAVAEVARERGIRVAHLDELPRECDAILAHDLPMAAALAERYPGARLVFVAHSDAFDLQLPPQLEGVVDAVVACSDRMAARVRATALDVPIVRLREPVDMDPNLVPARLPARPRRALLLSNYLRGSRLMRLVEALEAMDIEWTQVGAGGKVLLDPTPEIRKADIVVAKARAALEAMAAGRAVYVYDQFGGDGWVTADTYPAFEADHFAGQALPAPRSLADLATDLNAYDPEMGVVNNELARTHHGARHHAMELVGVLRGSHRADEGVTDILGELARLARASSQAESRMWDAWGRAESAEEDRVVWQERATEAERAAHEARMALTTKRVRAGLALGRVADRIRGRS